MSFMDEPRRTPVFGAVPSHAWRVLRDEGPRSLAVRALAQTIYRRLALFALEVGGEAAAPPPPRLSAELLDTGSLDDYLALRPDIPRGEVSRRLAAGERCFLTRLDGRLVEGVWVADGRVRIAYLHCQLQLASDEVYVYDAHTAPHARGRAISARVRFPAMNRLLADDGYRRMLALVLPENRSGMRLVEKYGYRRIGRVATFRLGPWRWSHHASSDGRIRATSS